MSDRHWQILIELVAVVTTPGMDVEHAELLLGQAQAVLALSVGRQGSEPIMPAPHIDQLHLLGLR